MVPTAVFDLHCDTLTAFMTPNRCPFTLDDPASAFALSRLPAGVDWCQCCAVFVPDGLTQEEAWRYYCFHRDRFFRQAERFASRAAPCRTGEDIVRAWEQGKTSLVLTVENACFLAGGLDRAEVLSRDGVRMASLTWNGPNALGSGSQTEEGLTPLGRAAVAALEEAGITLDVSHLNDAGFRDVLAAARHPFAATHSNARAICPHRRNLEDWQIREMAIRNCIIGLNYYSPFLRSDGNEADLDDLCRHIIHFLELGAGDCLALGSDFDGADLPPWLDSCAKVPALWDRLLSAGLDRSGAEKLFWKNALAFARKNWSQRPCAPL